MNLKYVRFQQNFILSNITYCIIIISSYPPQSFRGYTVFSLSNTGDLAVSWNEPVAFGVLSPTFVELETKLYFDRDKNGRIFKSFDFMAVDEWRGHILQSCNIGIAVYCFNFKGVPKFKYTHDKLGQPGGIALDTYEPCSVKNGLRGFLPGLT